MEDPCYTLTAPLEDNDVQEMGIRNDFEKGDPKKQAKALEHLINKMMHGEFTEGAFRLMLKICIELQNNRHTGKFHQVAAKTPVRRQLSVREMILFR